MNQNLVNKLTTIISWITIFSLMVGVLYLIGKTGEAYDSGGLVWLIPLLR